MALANAASASPTGKLDFAMTHECARAYLQTARRRGGVSDERAARYDARMKLREKNKLCLYIKQHRARVAYADFE